jgi:hypothetical protein
MRWPKLLLVILLAALNFGGSFTCKSSSNHDDHNHHDHD